VSDLKLDDGITFVFGGARSGKSRFAENLILSSGLTPLYLATGRAMDDEMNDRILAHQERRGKDWETMEEPLALADAVAQSAYKGRAVLVDSLAMWVTNLMMAEANVMRECDSLIASLSAAQAPVVLVSDEVGLGIVPDNPMARAFRDHAGDVNQKIARIADEAWFVAAGLPFAMKKSD
jgi:adenosylcobinamide kinase / adenosylcobinamide-phosphate guanylyltransferase